MLNFAYQSDDGNIQMPDEANGTRKNIDHCIALYRVADKYDFPHLLHSSRWAFYIQLRLWLGGPIQTTSQVQSPASPKEFREIVSSIYELPNANLEHPLVSAVIQMTKLCEKVNIFRAAGRESTLLADAAKEVPEFGRDLFFHMTEAVGTEECERDEDRRITELGILVKVKCPHCAQVWSNPCGSSWEGHCWECGGYDEDWSAYEWH